MVSKEFGSDFHYTGFFSAFIPWRLQDTLTYTFSGRSALRLIIEQGIEKLGWKRIYVPTYYCHEVLKFIKDLKVEYIYYPCNPLNSEINFPVQDEESSAFLKVNYFGFSEPDVTAFKKVFVIEDITHDLQLLKTTKAQAAFASLRKTFPVPAGGLVYWGNLPPYSLPHTPLAKEVAFQKSCAMFLKTKYLSGELGTKDIFRQLYTQAEDSFEDLETHAALPLFLKESHNEFDVDWFFVKKQQNFEKLSSLTAPTNLFQVLNSDSGHSFMYSLYFYEESHRDRLRKYLIDKNIYPVVLWPEQFAEKDINIQNRLLLLHIDFRYSSEDMEYFAEIINNYTVQYA